MASVVLGREISRQLLVLWKMILTTPTLPSDDVYASLCLMEFVAAERIILASGDPEPPEVHSGKAAAGRVVRKTVRAAPEGVRLLLSLAICFFRSPNCENSMPESKCEKHPGNP